MINKKLTYIQLVNIAQCRNQSYDFGIPYILVLIHVEYQEFLCIFTCKFALPSGMTLNGFISKQYHN